MVYEETKYHIKAAYKGKKVIMVRAAFVHWTLRKPEGLRHARGKR
jgi:hypothetical protein